MDPIAAYDVRIAAMSIDDHDAVVALWNGAEAVNVSTSDSRDAIDAFLKRNADLGLVARGEGQTVGAILCGHDGRRGGHARPWGVRS